MTDTALWVAEGHLDGILLTQVEMDASMWPLIEQFQSLHEPTPP